MNLDALKGKIVTVWLGTQKREISGVLTAVTETAVEVRCTGTDESVTVWQIVRAEIIAIGCNEGQ